MAHTNWNQRFLSTTRGRIITLLRRAGRSVEELAQALDLTHTAVRAHLAALERDGLVQQRSERRGKRKRCVFAGIGALSLRWCLSIQRCVASLSRCSRSWLMCPCRNNANELVQCHAASSCPCKWNTTPEYMHDVTRVAIMGMIFTELLPL